MEVKISPSVLACDLSQLASECKRMEEAGAHYIHLDVMDGCFVPNITFGAPLIKPLRNKTSQIFDTHLMISNPDKYIDDFADAGCNIITIHIESCCDIWDTIKKIKQRNIKAGLAIKPATPVNELVPYLQHIDMALVMTVEPGFGRQAFMDDMLEKVKFLRHCAGNGLDIQVDGGINAQTAAKSCSAGANVLVAGSYLFSQSDYKKAVSELMDICSTHSRNDYNR